MDLDYQVVLEILDCLLILEVLVDQGHLDFQWHHFVLFDLVRQ